MGRRACNVSDDGFDVDSVGDNGFDMDPEADDSMRHESKKVWRKMLGHQYLAEARRHQTPRSGREKRESVVNLRTVSENAFVKLTEEILCFKGLLLVLFYNCC